MELKDPNNTRRIKQMPLPPQRPLPTQNIFKNNTIDWRLIRNHLKKQGKIARDDYITLIKMATHLFRNEPNLVKMQDPVTIVGDIHGQFYDFIKLIEPDVGGDPASNKYLFLGDYVDRGNFSIQVLALIMSLKIAMPNNITVLRGNHQSKTMTTLFNFKKQCLIKYDQTVYDMVIQMFEALPLGCLVNERFLCIHGGISHDLRTLDDISIIDRFRQVPKSGLFCDLLWADPVDNEKGELQALVIPNGVRGCSYYFGRQLSNTFLENNKLISIIRAHEAKPQGFKSHKWKGESSMPSVITIFSAPNYCDYFKNKAAVIRLLNNSIDVRQFVESPHPYLLPNFMDIFSWSIPFLIQKVTQVFCNLIETNNEYQNVQLPFEFVDKKLVLQKFLEQQKKKVDENLYITNLNGSCPDNKILQTGKYRETLDKSFEDKKKIDQINEHYPEF